MAIAGNDAVRMIVTGIAPQMGYGPIHQTNRPSPNPKIPIQQIICFHRMRPNNIDGYELKKNHRVGLVEIPSKLVTVCSKAFGSNRFKD